MSKIIIKSEKSIIKELNVDYFSKIASHFNNNTFNGKSTHFYFPGFSICIS